MHALHAVAGVVVAILGIVWRVALIVFEVCQKVFKFSRLGCQVWKGSIEREIPVSSVPGVATPNGSHSMMMKRLISHSLGSHVVSISIRLRGHLGMSHRHLVHLGSRGMRVGESRAAVCLVRRVRERRQRTALVVELRPHVGTTARLVRSLSEIRARRVGHLSLVARLGVSAATATLVRVATASRTVTHVVAHVAVGRLGRLATQMLRTGAERSLWCWAHLCEQRVKMWGSQTNFVRSRFTRPGATRAPSRKKNSRQTHRWIALNCTRTG